MTATSCILGPRLTTKTAMSILPTFRYEPFYIHNQGGEGQFTGLLSRLKREKCVFLLSVLSRRDMYFLFMC